MTLDQASLEQLRAIVRALHASNAGQPSPSLASVVRLARELRVRAGVTVDFEATPELGQPLVVVRVLESAPAVQPASLRALTPREREIAELVAAGLSNKEIARRLGLTLGTVKHYVHQILDKTGLRGRVAIATAAQATAWDSASPPIFG
jgi:DNA-binding NarL/FixJ family response regulator